MVRYVVGRLLGIVGVLVAVSVITFLMMHAVPGGPFDAAPQQEMPIPEHIRARLLRMYNLDKPIHVQYLSYMEHAVRGDLGVSFHYGEPVTRFLRRSWPTTVQLGLATLIVSLSIGLTVGTLAALRPNSALDRLASLGVVTGLVVPPFVMAVLLILVFSVKLRWLPTGGWGAPRQMILPVFAYASGPAAILARYTRAGLVAALRSDYVRTAHAKGVPRHWVVVRHGLRTALIPLLTVVGPLVAWMITGSFFIETIFRVPGIGSQLTLGIYNRDYPVIMALTLVWASIVALAYLATDLLYVVVDPRVHLAGAAR